MGLHVDELQDEVERLLRRCNIETLLEVGTLLGAIQKVCHCKSPNFWTPFPLVTVCHRLP